MREALDAREPRGPQRCAGGRAEKPKAESYDPAEWGSLPGERAAAVLWLHTHGTLNLCVHVCRSCMDQQDHSSLLCTTLKQNNAKRVSRRPPQSPWYMNSFFAVVTRFLLQRSAWRWCRELEPFNQLCIKSAQSEKTPPDCNSYNLLDLRGSSHLLCDRSSLHGRKTEPGDLSWRYLTPGFN